MRPPSIDYTPFHAVTDLTSLASPVQLVQTAPGSATAVLRVLRERDCTLYAVPLHLFRRLVG